MATSASGSGKGDHDLSNLSSTDSESDGEPDSARTEGRQTDGSEHRRSKKSNTYYKPNYMPRSEDFMNDEMSLLGSIDFVSVDRVKYGHGFVNIQPSLNYRGTVRPCELPALERPVEEEPVFVSKKKIKSRLWRSRKRAWKAEVKRRIMERAQAAGDDSAADGEVNPEEEGRKRKESPAANTEPESKITKTESTGSDISRDSENMEAVQIAETLTTSSPVAEDQSGGLLSIEAEPAQEPQEEEVPRPDCDTVIYNEQMNEDEPPAVECKSAAEGEPSMMTSTKHQDKIMKNPKYRQRKRRCPRRPRVRTTAHRIVFVCRICHFRTFYQKKLESHLESKFHKDHFSFLSENLSEQTVDFLQTHFRNKYKKVENLVKRTPNHRDTCDICQLYEDSDLTQDISMENFMRKAEAAHCLACDVYIPMRHSSIQQHLKCPDHKYNCKNMMMQSKQSGLAIAKTIIRNQLSRMKLKHHIEDSTVTDGPQVEPERVEPPCERVSQATEAVTKGSKQQVEPVCEEVVPSAEEMKSMEVEETPERTDLIESIFNLLGEDEDVEGVELGEEELGEDDFS